MKIFLGVILTLFAFLMLAMIFIQSGWYNVSAMNEESGMMKWVFNTTKTNSVESRSEDISVPDLNDSSFIKEGFEHYNEMCVGCHGAPGEEETELSKGLNPPAPYLVESPKETDARRLFWVTKNGIRMTGMPAWGKTHSDEKIWAIVAFIKALPDLTAEDYKKMGNGSEDVTGDKDHQENDTQNSHSKNKTDHHH